MSEGVTVSAGKPTLRGQKKIDAQNAEKLRQIRFHLGQARDLMFTLEKTGREPDVVILRHSIDQAEEYAKKAHEMAHFGAYDTLLKETDRCTCDHEYRYHPRSASGAYPCTHHGCGCSDFAEKPEGSREGSPKNE